MIIRLFLENFLSFDRFSSIELFPNPDYKSLYHHITTHEGSVPLLKLNAIFGHNGAGKTNLITAIAFIKDFALNKDFLNEIDIEHFFFFLKEEPSSSAADNSTDEASAESSSASSAVLSANTSTDNSDAQASTAETTTDAPTSTKQAPLKLSIEFATQGAIFFYEIELTKNKELIESLYQSFPSEERLGLIFERNKDTIKIKSTTPSDSQPFNTVTSKLLEQHPLSSVLSLLKEKYDKAADNNELVADGSLESSAQEPLSTLQNDLRFNKVLNFFSNELIIIDQHLVNDSGFTYDQYQSQHLYSSAYPSTSPLPYQHHSTFTYPHKNQHQRALAFLIQAIREDDKLLDFLNSKVAKLNIGISSLRLNKQSNGAYELLFTYQGRDRFKKELDSSLLTKGSLQALVILSVLFKATTQEATIVVDNLDQHLSFTMTEALVEYFANSDTKGQLIFTTHETFLLDCTYLLRIDEIWFFDKTEGATLMYSLNDFKPRSDISPFRGYNDGRYGAIRFIERLSCDDDDEDDEDY